MTSVGLNLLDRDSLAHTVYVLSKGQVLAVQVCISLARLHRNKVEKVRMCRRQTASQRRQKAASHKS